MVKFGSEKVALCLSLTEVALCLRLTEVALCFNLAQERQQFHIFIVFKNIFV